MTFITCVKVLDMKPWCWISQREYIYHVDNDLCEKLKAKPKTKTFPYRLFRHTSDSRGFLLQ